MGLFEKKARLEFIDIEHIRSRRIKGFEDLIDWAEDENERVLEAESVGRAVLSKKNKKGKILYIEELRFPYPEYTDFEKVFQKFGDHATYPFPEELKSGLRKSDNTPVEKAKRQSLVDEVSVNQKIKTLENSVERVVKQVFEPRESEILLKEELNQLEGKFSFFEEQLAYLTECVEGLERGAERNLSVGRHLPDSVEVQDCECTKMGRMDATDTDVTTGSSICSLKENGQVTQTVTDREAEIGIDSGCTRVAEIDVSSGSTNETETPARTDSNAVRKEIPNISKRIEAFCTELAVTILEMQSKKEATVQLEKEKADWEAEYTERLKRLHQENETFQEYYSSNRE
ncbi:MAG: hypothetical protein LBD38_01180 [Streptococcaceae bacterium]|jgi:hypothetical protein|nr:hypothetical protein [Streptococcaceae bacterium]